MSGPARSASGWSREPVDHRVPAGPGRELPQHRHGAGADDRRAEALASYEKARAIQERLAREHPESPDFAIDLGVTLNNMAMIDLDQRRFDKARDTLTRAIEWQRKALATNPNNPTYRQFLASQLDNLIRATEGLGRCRGRRSQARAGRASQLGPADRGPRRPAGRRAQG